MTYDQLIFFTIMIISMILFMTEYLRVDVVAVLIILALSITGILDAKEAFSGLSSEPAIIVAAVFVLSAGLSFTGVTDLIGEWVMRLSGKSEMRSIFVIMIAVAVMSAFTHHLMVTAMMLPIVMKISKAEKSLHASRLLIPMATAASLGTTLTLIGAPALLLANNILSRNGEVPLGFFTIGQVGLPLVFIGILFCVLMKWLLPKTSGVDDKADDFRLTDVITELIVSRASSLIDQSFEEFETKTSKQFQVIDWIRADGSRVEKEPQIKIAAGDTFIVNTNPDELMSFDGNQGLFLKALRLFKEGEESILSLAGEEKRILKAVIAPKSEFVGRSVGQINFYIKFGVAVVGIWRKSGWISAGVTDAILQAGDMLVIWGPKEKLDNLNLHRGFLMLLRFYGTTMKRSKSLTAAAIMLGSIALSASGLLPVYIAFVAGAVMMILSKCVDVPQAYASIETRIFVMIAGVIPLGLAMEKTNVDQLLASLVIKLTSGWEPFAMLLVFFWIASLVTQILSDAATTVLLAPVAIAFAKVASISPTSAVVCVTIGSVASFLTPIGHHGNLLILSPGGYRFSDFLKIGLPLTVILSLVTCYLALKIWSV